MYPPLIGRARQHLTVWGLGAVLERLEHFLDEPQLRASLIQPSAFVRPKRLYSLRVTIKIFLITGCEFSAAQELLVLATGEGNSSMREQCGQKNAEDSGAQSDIKRR